jgi:hypothetical protein
VLKLFTWFWNGLRQAAGLVLPVFSRATDFRKWSPAVKWVIHFVLLALILVLLTWVNNYFEIYRILGRTQIWAVKVLWLPLMFLLVYALSWLGWWLWKLLWPEDEESQFPDIDEAWAEAVDALHQAGIDLTEAPLFLVLGRPAGGEAALFQAAQLQLPVKMAPQRADAPLHVFGSRDGIYVTCAGASLLGRQSLMFVGVGASPETNGAPGSPNEPDFGKTMVPTGRVKEVQAILRKARVEKRELTENEKRQIRMLEAEDRMQQGVRKEAARAAVLKNPDEIERTAARLRHLCRLIVRDRRPYCPLNGILLVLPLAATEADETANAVAALLQQDLTVTRDVLQLQCPVLALVTDLELVPGFSEFMEQFDDQERHRRVGHRLVLVPDLPREEVSRYFEDVVRHVCQGLTSTWVYKYFKLEETREELPEVVKFNSLLYQVLHRLRQLDRPLARILNRALVTPHAVPFMLGGCYFGGTGPTPTQQAFVGGVFRRLKEEENRVSWTPEAIDEERDYDRWTQWGYAGLGVFLLVAGAVAAVCTYAWWGGS